MSVKPVPKPSWWKTSQAEWDWYCYRNPQAERASAPAVVVPPWPGVDGVPKRAKTIAEKLTPKPPRSVKSRETPMRGLPWGCKTAEEYGREYRRRQKELEAQAAQTGGPTLRKRSPAL